jgi:hypothetical protein
MDNGKALSKCSRSRQLRCFQSNFFKNTPLPPPSIPVALPLKSPQISGSTFDFITCIPCQTSRPLSGGARYEITISGWPEFVKPPRLRKYCILRFKFVLYLGRVTLRVTKRRVRGVAPSLPLDQQYDIAFDAKSAEDGQPMPNQMGMSQLAMRARQQQDNFGGTVPKTVGESCRHVATSLSSPN